MCLRSLILKDIIFCLLLTVLLVVGYSLYFCILKYIFVIDLA